MGDIVNLRRMRKQRDRRAAETAAAENRVAFGRSRTEKEVTEAVRALDQRKLDGHRRNERAEGASDDDA